MISRNCNKGKIFRACKTINMKYDITNYDNNENMKYDITNYDNNDYMKI